MLNFLFTQTPLSFFTQSLWRDEAFSYLLAKMGIIKMINLTAYDFNPPLYYFLLHYWIKLFGSSEIAIRSLSLLFFCATIYIVYLFLTEILNLSNKKSFIYMILFLCNPLLLFFAFEARMYSLFAFLSALSFFALCKKRERLYFFVTLLGLYTHYFMVLVLISQLLFIILAKAKKIILLPLRQIAYPFLVFIPWTLFILNKMPFSDVSWIPFSDPRTIFYFPSLILFGYQKNFHYFPINKELIFFLLVGLSLLLIGLVISGFILMAKNRNSRLFWIALCLLIWAFFPTLTSYLISFIKPIYVPRYLIFSTVGITFLFIFIISKMPKLLAVVFAFVLLLSSVSFLTLKVVYEKKPDIRKTISEIKKLAKKDDFLYVTNELDFFTAQYYFDENRVYIYGKTYDDIPDYVGKILIPKEKISTNLPVYPKKAFILKADLSYDIQAVF